MIISMVSDQLYDWSDKLDQDVDRRLAEKTRRPSSSASAAGFGSSRFAHRALQALWQARLQVCRWPRSRSQALLVGELPGDPADHGIRAAIRSRCGRGTAGELSRGAADPRPDLLAQPRDPASKRRAGLKRRGVCGCHRHRSCCGAAGEHDAGFLGNGARAPFIAVSDRSAPWRDR